MVIYGENIEIGKMQWRELDVRLEKMKWNKKFEYPKSQRSLIQGKRHYDIGQTKLPSVTTILSAT